MIRSTKSRETFDPSGAGGFAPEYSDVIDAGDYTPTEAMGRIRGQLGLPVGTDNYDTLDAVRKLAAALRLADALAEAAESTIELQAAVTAYRGARSVK